MLIGEYKYWLPTGLGYTDNETDLAESDNYYRAYYQALNPKSLADVVESLTFAVYKSNDYDMRAA